MTMSKSGLLRAGLLSVSMIVPISAHALTITQNNDANALANNLFLNLPGLFDVSATISGASAQSGTYTNVIGTYGLPQNGIVLSSGNVSDYGAGGNANTDTSTEFDEFGGGETTIVLANGVEIDENDVTYDPNTDEPFFDFGNGLEAVELEFIEVGGGSATENQLALLSPITGSDSHFDVVQLDIEFETATNVSSATFFAAFGSEEWQEFVGQFNDGFGLYVNGVNQAGVAEFNGGTPLPVNIDHPSMAAITGTELDGVLAPGSNPVLRFDVPLEPGTTNNFTIILADTNDAALDTTIYLSSFIAANPGGGSGEPVPATGATEFDPLLPITNANGDPVFDENGAFIVEISADLIANGQTVWIDPPVTVGYTYKAEDGFLFTEVTAPSLGTVADIDGYMIKINGTNHVLTASTVFDILAANGGLGVNSFEITGIDTSLNIDPSNPLAFPVGVKTNGDGSQGVSITITPHVFNTDPVNPNPSAVPLPASGLLYLGAVLVGGGLLRRRQKAS